MSTAVARDDDIDRRRPPLAAVPGPTSASESESPSTERSAPHRPRVLVVDDNPGLRETLYDILAHEGYAVEQAGDGHAALAILANSRVDVIILDLAMPLMNGVEFLRQIDPPPPLVIIHSAFAYFHEDDVRGQVGAKVFRAMKKPVRPSQLLAAVSDAIGTLGDD